MIEIGSTKYLCLNELYDNSAGSYINDATVAYSLQTPTGTEVDSGSLSYEADSDGKYEGNITAVTTATLTDCAEYIVIITATSGTVVQKFVERMIAIATTGNWLRFDSHYFDELGTLTDAQRAVLTTKIKATQEAIEKYCNRVFAQTDHDEILRAEEDGSVVLPNFPVISFKRLCDKTISILSLSHSTAQVASVSTTDAAVKVTSVSAGVETTNTLTFADNVTLSAMATAVSALSGWSCSISDTDWNSYPSADLVAFQYASCKDTGYLYAWDHSSQSFKLEELTGIVRGIDYGRGTRVRVEYTAGFADVPEEIKNIAATLAMNSFDESQQSVQQESIGDYSYQLKGAAEQLEKLPLNNKMILNQYRDRRV